jgi:hypothetical protein
MRSPYSGVFIFARSLLSILSISSGTGESMVRAHAQAPELRALRPGLLKTSRIFKPADYR